MSSTAGDQTHVLTPPSASKRRRSLQAAAAGNTLRYGARHTGPLAIANIAALILQFASAIFYTRFLSTADYGRYSYVFGWIGLLSVFTLPGIALALARAASLGEDGALVPATRARIRWGFAGSAALLGGAGWTYWQGSGETALAFVVAALLFPFYNAFENYSSWLAGKRRFASQAAWRIATLSATAFCTWVAILVVPRVPVLLFVNLAAGIAVSGLAYFLTVRHLRHDDSGATTIGYGKRLSLLGVLGVIESRIDILVVGTFLPLPIVAQLSIAESVVDTLAKRAWNAINQPFFPRWASLDRRAAYAQFRVDTVVQVAVTTVLFTGLIPLIPVVFPLVFTSKYNSAIILAQIIVAASIVGVPGASAETFFLAQKAEREQWTLRIAMTVSHLALLPPLLLVWGVKGAVIAVLCSRAAYSVVAVFLARRFLRKSGP